MSNGIFDVIRNDLEALEDCLRSGVASSNDLVSEVGAHLLDAGGKRIRPALCLLAAHGGKEFSLSRVLPLAAAFELIHTASLVHDDVIDEADTRRGEPTANAKWNNQVAILSGDFLFARAFRFVADGQYGHHVTARLADLVCNLSIGEIIQDREVYKAYRDENHYYERVEKKTADFLEISCELGAYVGGLSESAMKALGAYGHAIGMAFQITDDLLDILETSEQIGKPVGNDIRQGLLTLPVIHAMRVSDCADELASIVTNPKMTDADVERALEIIRATDAEDFARGRAEAYLKEAKDALPAELPEEIRKAFADVADFIGARNF